MRVTTVAALASCLIFAAACSDSATGVPSSSLRPGDASLAGNPPPPPLTGRGDGELDPFSSDISTFAATTETAALNACGSLAATPLSYEFDYLLNKEETNEWAHLKLDDQNHQVTIHQTSSKIDANGEIVGPDYVFRLTGGATGELDAFGFSLVVDGIVTLSDGTRCHAQASLSGDLVGEVIGN
jgi:hypothetical protein